MPREFVGGDGAAEFDLIVVAEAAPGNIAALDIAKLRRVAPLARIVGLLASWCEGETRSGKPWPGVPRVYWHQWQARYRRERAAMLAGKLSGWTLPPGTSDEERMQKTAQALGEIAIRPVVGKLAIVARDLETFETLAGLCNRSGQQATWWRNEIPAEAANFADIQNVLVCCTHANEVELARFRQIRELLSGARIVALMDFPREEDVRLAGEAGVDAVVSKPFSIDELRSAMCT